MGRTARTAALAISSAASRMRKLRRHEAIGRIDRVILTAAKVRFIAHLGQREFGLSVPLGGFLFPDSNGLQRGFDPERAQQSHDFGTHRRVHAQAAEGDALPGAVVDVCATAAVTHTLTLGAAISTAGDDRNGVLQDIHWYAGMIGYFPTYTVGAIWAAQLYEAARAANPGLEDAIRTGEFDVLVEWLHAHVHRLGRSAESSLSIMSDVTGTPLDRGL